MLAARLALRVALVLSRWHRWDAQDLPDYWVEGR